MRIVEREGTGIKPVCSQTLKTLGIAMVAAIGLAGQVHATPATVTVSDCGTLSVGIAADGQLLVGNAALESGYAVVGLQVYSGDDGAQIFAAGEGTGLTDEDTNAAGEGTGIDAAGEGTGVNAAGEGTGGEADDTAPETNAAGEGTGLADTELQINAAGEGTGNPEAVWGWAEIALSSDTTADMIVYRQSQSALTEYSTVSNVAVSGLASGIGCDRE